MAESSRVEELRKRYHENPRRFFAPLANEYRKSGFLDRAILLCQKHLGEQPGNMNGLIVYGQALFESGRHEEARGPFGAALEVDPENLIALRHLGDIARLAGDNEEARTWYGRVLEYDRRNDEVRALLNVISPGEDVAPLEFVDLAESASAPPPDVEAPRPAPREPEPAVPESSAMTVEITPRPLASVKTAEVEARPQRRASLLDIDFDFGETASAEPVPPAARRPPTPIGLPSLDSPDAETEEPGVAEVAEQDVTPPAHPGEAGRAAVSGAFPLDAEFPMLESEPEGDYTDLGESLLEPEPDRQPVVESLLEPEPDRQPVSAAEPVEGLQLPDFSADVEPLPDLEPTEFTTGGTSVEPLPELETAEFVVPGADERIGSIIDFEPGEPEPEPPSRESGATQPEPDSIGSAGEGVDLPFLEVSNVEPAANEPTFDPTSTVPTPSTAPAIVTETMAELYLEQGFHAEAVEVYRTLIAQDPTDKRLKEKLATLERSRVSLEFATPTEGVDDIGERAPANAMLAEVSFEDVSSLGTPKTPARGAGRAPTPFGAQPGQGIAAIGSDEPTSGPTAREFFAAFAQRIVGAHPAVDSFSWAVPASASPLDALFGNAVRDEDQRAANRLAGIGTTSAPSGGSNLDSLFAVDAGEIIESPSASVPRASEKLRFDQFFSSTSTPPEPRTAEPGPEPTENAPDVESSARPPEPEPPAPKPPAPEPPAPEPSAPEPSAPEPPSGSDNDDVDRFHGWLKGLTE